ncbi:class I SAM-dependent methyltransferase [Rickettsiales bacterium]|nr:class I SAM-dependent methyltransferase [Rickettsiales bacterium]
MLECNNTDSKIKIEWGGFSLLEFLISESNEITKSFCDALDIGSNHGNHTGIMRDFGLNVDQIDKYNPSAEIHADFNEYKFKKKYDVIFCSHVVEHQRNIGFFLDKIYDILNEDGVLIISGPVHEAERFVEGHIASTIFPLFLQSLIYAGFDCKNGKTMMLGGVENSFIVKKAKNFDLSERQETGYKWTKKHHERSPMTLSAGHFVRNGKLELLNCEIWRVEGEEGFSFSLPTDYIPKGIDIEFCTWNIIKIFDDYLNDINYENEKYVRLKV